VNAKLQLVLWISHPALESLLAAVMVWRKLHRKFPVFFAFIVFQVVDFIFLFPIHQYGSYNFYFYSYWVSATISLGIGFKVIHEVFLDVFRPYHTLKDLGTILFKWAALVMIFVALVVAVASPGGQSPIVAAVMTMQRCVRVIQCGLVLFLLFFARYLAVSWRHHAFGIVCGFGLVAAAQLTGSALLVGGWASSQMAGFIFMLSYSCSILVWLGYAATKTLPRQASPLVSQRWEQSLTDLQRPAAAESLIPMFEGMVDRAFSNTSAEHQPEAFSTKMLRENSAPLSINGSLARVHSLR